MYIHTIVHINIYYIQMKINTYDICADKKKNVIKFPD